MYQWLDRLERFSKDYVFRLHVNLLVFKVDRYVFLLRKTPKGCIRNITSYEQIFINKNVESTFERR